MPINGALSKWDTIHFRATSSGSYTHAGIGDPWFRHQAICSANECNDYVVVSTGVGLATSSLFYIDSNGGSPIDNSYHQASVIIPTLGINWSVNTAGFASSIDLEVQIDNYWVYMSGSGTFYFSCGTIRIYWQGSLVQTYGGGSFSSPTEPFPGAMPLHGDGVYVQADCGVDLKALPAGGSGYPTPWSATITGTSTGVCGWRFLKDGVWTALPIVLPPVNLASNPGFPYNLTLAHAPSGSDTWTVNFTAWGKQTVSLDGIPGHDAYLGEWSGSGNVTIIPNVPKSIKRFNLDYAALWYRGKFPGVTERSTRSGQATVHHTPPLATSVLVTPIYNAESEFLATVGNAYHVIEDALTKPIYSGMTAGESVLESLAFIVFPQNRTPQEYLWFSFPDSVDGSLSVPASIPYLTHTDAMTRYINTWCNPLWSYCHYWANWTSYDQSLYWRPIREQWLYNSALPIGEQHKTRNFIISNPCGDSGLDSLQSTALGDYRWLGVSRWQTQEVTPLASVQLDSTSSAAWTPADCTLAFGADIVATPSASTIKLELSVGRFDANPYMYPAICSLFKPSFDSTNVAAARVIAVAWDGAEALIGSASGTTYPIPNAPTSEYAGSWAIDNGNGEASDTGTDVAAGGLSAATMADPVRIVSFGLLPARSVRKIRFEFDVVNPANPVTIHYPTWVYDQSGNALASNPTFVQENGEVVDFLWPNGTAIRLGNWLWYDPFIGLLTVPETLGLGHKFSVIDWLCSRRELFQNTDRASAPAGGVDLTTELTQLYDTFEGQSVHVVDEGSISFVLPTSSGGTVAQTNKIRAALINTFSEVPPLGAIPIKARSLVDWSQFGDYSNEAWDWAQEPRYYVNPGTVPMDLFSGSTQWTIPATGVLGWTITQHSHAVTNLESPNFKVVRDAIVFGNTTPWEGWYASLGLSPTEKYPWGIFDDQGRLHICTTKSGDLNYYRSFASSPSWEINQAITSVGNVKFGKMTIDQHTKQINLIFVDTSAAAWTMYSQDLGLTWTTPVAFVP